MTEDEMVGWHDQLNEREFGQTPGDIYSADTRVPGCGLGTGDAEEQGGHTPASGTDILAECY